MKKNNTLKKQKLNVTRIQKPNTMKTKTTIFKTAFIAFALFCSAQTFAQTYPEAPDPGISLPEDLNVGTVTFDGTTSSFASVTTNTVAFYKPDEANLGAPLTGFILQASLTDDNTVPITFESYIWYELSYDGTTETANVLTGEIGQTLTVSNLSAGYHKYRVKGQLQEGTVFCPSDEYQDMIVFVLPRLNVAPILTGTTLIYCENDVPATGSNTLTATIEADYTGNPTSAYPKPGDTDAAAAFSLTYQWYAVPATAPSTPIAIATSAEVDLSTLTTPLTPGTYTFYLEVEYATAIRSNVTEQRPYVIYKGNVDAVTGTVIVTATPGTPTITVDSVVD